MSARILVAACASLACAFSVAAQSTSTTITMAESRTAVASGKSMLAVGEYNAARASFDKVISLRRGLAENAESKRLISDAYFGRASAVHQQARAGDAPSPTNELATALAGYDSALALDPARFAGAANNNAGLLLRDAGRHEDALARFLAAARAKHPARASFLANAASEYAALGQIDSAGAAYRAALAEDSTLASAREGLLATFVRRPQPDSIVKLATRWSANPRHASQVTDAMYAMLEGGSGQSKRLSSVVADTCLTLLALNFTTLGLGPTDIAKNHAERLRNIALTAPSTAGGIDALLAAYALKPGDPRRLNAKSSPSAHWWTDNFGRRTLWSAVLRSIGNWYDTRGDDANAIAYYEAATSRPWQYNEAPPWMDLDAIFPLAVLYAQPEAVRADPQRLDRFIEGIFNSKQIAYNSQDFPRIRRFHTGLGAFFASRGEWGKGSHGAIFQLERMREATRRINAANPASAAPLRDSPDLLAQLAKGYCATNQLQKAAEITAEVIAVYQRLERPQNAISASCGRKPTN